MIDPATGQQLVAAPMMAHGQVFQPSVQIAGADGAVYAVQVIYWPLIGRDRSRYLNTGL